MDDLTYEFQRMNSRATEIKDAAGKQGLDAAWEQYSQTHGLNLQRFRTELPKLRARFQGIASGKKL